MGLNIRKPLKKWRVEICRAGIWVLWDSFDTRMEALAEQRRLSDQWSRLKYIDE